MSSPTNVLLNQAKASRRLGDRDDQDEVSASIIVPHFDAVRDVFSGYEPSAGESLGKLGRTKLVVDPAMHDGGRHYAGCRDNGLEIRVAPEAADLPLAVLVAILSHEFGHAADFAFPGRWKFVEQRLPARWLEGGVQETKDRKRWNDRSEDEVEWSADAIALAVTGRVIGYCGRCMIQCFEGKPRPRGLR